MGIRERFKSLFNVAEGSHRGPFMGVGELGGSYMIDPLGDGWQRNLDVSARQARHVPGVYACVMLIARSISQCYPKHVRSKGGDFNSVTNSAAYRVLNRPNSYQATPDFLLNLVATALFEGEAFCVASRNDRNEVSNLHLLPPGACSPMVDDETKQIFYAIGSSPLNPNGTDYVAPQRDVLHLRFHTPRHPLVGETCIKAAAMAININVSLNQSQQAFFAQMSRPSGVLSTDMKLTGDQMLQLRKAFEAQSKDMNQGRIPILGSGIKWQPLSITSQDAQLVQAQQLSLEDICRVFGVPGPLVNDLAHATLSNAETLMQAFMAMSLGSYIEHIERQFDLLFGLSADEYIEFDTAALLRTDFSGRVDGLTKAVQGGLMTPTEARAREGLGPIAGGETAYLQRQMVPIDKINELLEQEKAPEPQPVIPDPTADIEEGKTLNPEYAKLLLADMMQKKVAA